MTFLPFEKMWDQIEIARDDNDMSLFMNLTYMAEMLTKTVVGGLTAAIDDDRSRNRYSVIYKLVRADGLGDWISALDEILTGTSAQFLSFDILNCSKELTEKVGKGSWQYDAYDFLAKCLTTVDCLNEPIPTKIDGRKWFIGFVTLRNKTRAHGAPQGGKCALLCENLEKSIRMIIDNFSLFKLPWAYLHRNYSGKYRVSKITTDITPFEFLKKSNSTNLPNLEDGVYVYLGANKLVELIHSDPDLFDFYYPNGQFTPKKYELISYITDNKLEGDSSKYLFPASELPASETQGKDSLDVLGQSFSNLPQSQENYIPRLGLEEELKNALFDDNHPMITLRGRGGIGKTWLTLHVLHDISKSAKFISIIWFSARDIDLLSSGPKRVKPQVLDERDIAEEFAQLINPSESSNKDFKPISFLQENLTKSRIGPILFVFDNFETVKHPTDLYTWIDTYLRLPNKVLITTRVRDFKADYNVDVSGMNESEAENLILRTSESFNISQLLTSKYIQTLISESEGHPYVIKIMLGEVAKAHKLVTIERVVANSDEMLKALFERTYNNLSPAAKRVFLTLVNSRSVIPQIALEAVLLRPENERMDVLNAIEELEKSSFIEINASKSDKQIFLSVPLVTVIFGEKKLAVSPLKSAIQADNEILQAFGNTQGSEISSGLAPRIDKLYKNVAEKMIQDKKSFDYYLPILKFVATQYPEAWLSMATLYEENLELDDRLDKARECVQFFLESAKSIEKKRKAWRMVATYSRRLEDWLGEAHALVELAQLPNSQLEDISNSANRINALLKDELELDDEVKTILVKRLLETMEKLTKERPSATDYSRMAWLAWNIKLVDKAKEYTEIGLQIDPENSYIESLASRLGIY